MEHELNKHYKKQNIKTDVIEFAQEHNLDFIQGNVMKYIYRYKLKGTPIADLTKVIDYTTRALSKEEYLNADVENIINIVKNNLITKEIDKELNTLPVKCETTPSTPFKDELAEYMIEYIEKIKNLRKNIKTIWNENGNSEKNNASEIAGK